MDLSFVNADAAEMVLRMGQGTRMSLEVMSIDNNDSVTLGLVVTLNGERVMVGDQTIRARVGDTIEVPQTLNLQFTTV